MKFRVPLSEIITDFFDVLKSISRGYGSMDYEIVDYEVNNLLKDWWYKKYDNSHNGWTRFFILK